MTDYESMTREELIAELKTIRNERDSQIDLFANLRVRITGEPLSKAPKIAMAIKQAYSTSRVKN